EELNAPVLEIDCHEILRASYGAEDHASAFEFELNRVIDAGLSAQDGKSILHISKLEKLSRKFIRLVLEQLSNRNDSCIIIIGVDQAEEVFALKSGHAEVHSKYIAEFYGSLVSLSMPLSEA
ncbi:MAG: hypothetical protein KDD42_03315, partial [Bdellovibrionales bacterium]|nr:hypothetical protein [Bdellovibrionales bacterium]